MSIRYAWLPRFIGKDNSWSHANQESRYKYEIQNYLFLINDNISFTKLTSLLLHLEI